VTITQARLRDGPLLVRRRQPRGAITDQRGQYPPVKAEIFADWQTTVNRRDDPGLNLIVVANSLRG
jgi:hypothetical protein